jgi:GNAT superfamily N-acetyltransferase
VSTRAGPSAYALLTDGTTIEIRVARPEDFAAVRELHAKMSPDNLYLRFFSMSPAAADQEARRICREPGPDHAALLAVLDGEVVGCGAYELAGDGGGPAEVADDMHNRGIGTLLLEHLRSGRRAATSAGRRGGHGPDRSGPAAGRPGWRNPCRPGLRLSRVRCPRPRPRRALRRVARHPPGTIPDLDGLHQDRARELVASFLASTPQGGWLPRELTTQLLGCYGVR